MAFAPAVSEVFFPLDEELALLPGTLTPSLYEHQVRLGTWMPFARAAKELGYFHHVTVSEASARRATEGAGAALVEQQSEAVEAIERTCPPPPEGPQQQLLSVDGAMVPLLHREWAEVKTLVIGAIQPPVQEKGEMVVHTTDLSYFSRLADADTFGRLALVEIQRRGVEQAKTVCAVTDGAEWEQGFIDLHRPDAIRILDFAHAAEYVAAAGAAIYGEGSETTQDWLAATLHELKRGEAEQVLSTLRALPASVTDRTLTAAERATVTTSLNYLEKRRPQIDYARFQACGYPIGSGSVESGHWVVVEARLKGAGMHWARPHVNPMLALRNLVCNDRWDEAWPQIVERLRQTARGTAIQRQQRHQRPLVVVPSPAASVTPAVATASSRPKAVAKAERPDTTVTEATPRRPAANHPWRRSPVGRARYRSTQSTANART